MYDLFKLAIGALEKLNISRTIAHMHFLDLILQRDPLIKLCCKRHPFGPFNRVTNYILNSEVVKGRS